MQPPYWQPATPYLAVLALLFTGALIRARPLERSVYLNTLSLFAVGIAGQAAAPLVHALGMVKGAWVVHGAFEIVAAIALIRLAGFIVFRVLMPLAGRHFPRIVEDLAIIVVYVAYGLAELRGAGVELSSIVTTSAILTAVVAFAMQDTLGNVLGGLAIQLDNSVQVGDWIRLDDLSGRVRDIRWRSTLIETRNWETVVIPNSVLMKSRVAILGRREGFPLQWRRMLTFMVDPGVPPARVIATVDDEMREVAIPNVARSPAPSCVLIGFEQGNLRYQLRYFLEDLLEDDLTDSMVRVHLFASLQRAGIRVAEPQHKVQSVQRDDAHAEKVRQRELTRRLEALRAVPLLEALTDEERNGLAEQLQYAPFARGDIIARQGDAAHWLYVIAYGEAEVRYEAGEQPARVIGILRRGEFFGEMGLMGGDGRHATVVAKTDVECYRLDRAAFQALLASRPDLAQRLSGIVGSRHKGLDEVRAELRTAPPAQPEAEEDFLARVRRLLGIGG